MTEFTHTRPQLSLEEQLELFDKYLDAATDRLLYQFTVPALRRVVQRTAKERLIKNFETYGDAMWHRHPDELMIENIEELADAICYLIGREHGRAGGPGSRL